MRLAERAKEVNGITCFAPLDTEAVDVLTRDKRAANSKALRAGDSREEALFANNKILDSGFWARNKLIVEIANPIIELLRLTSILELRRPYI